MYHFDIFDKLISTVLCYVVVVVVVVVVDVFCCLAHTCTVSKPEAIYDSMGHSYKAEMVLIELRPKEWLKNVEPKPRKARKSKTVQEDEVQKPSGGDTAMKGDDAEPEMQRITKKRTRKDADEIPKATRASLQEFFGRRESF